VCASSKEPVGSVEIADQSMFDVEACMLRERMKALEIAKHQSIFDLHAFMLMHSSCVRLSAGANRQDDARERPSGDDALTFALSCCVFWRVFCR